MNMCVDMVVKLAWILVAAELTVVSCSNSGLSTPESTTQLYGK